MEVVLAIITGILYAAGIYMMMRRSIVKLSIGVILFSNGVNLLIFLSGRLKKGKPPLIPGSSDVFIEAYTDPIPQALILTAIVISFGLQAFAIVLVKRAYKVLHTDDLDQLNTTDEDS